jgi:hypothetical protein
MGKTKSGSINQIIKRLPRRSLIVDFLPVRTNYPLNSTNAARSALIYPIEYT